jgi:hypothetical protein
MTVLRVLRTAKATLTRTFFLDELGTDATGDVAVAVTRLDGTAVESGNAIGPTAAHSYSYTFGGLDVLDELVVTWSATVGGDAVILDQDRLQISGGFYFGLAEGRAVDPALTNTTTYPTADLIARRIETEDECERICGQAFVPRFRRAVLSGAGRPVLVLPDPWLRAVRAVTVNGSVYSAGQLAALGRTPLGILRNTSGWPDGDSNIVVEYEHGRDHPPPEVVAGSKIRFKSLMLSGRSALPDRAERIATTELGLVMLASPSTDKVGIPEVDAKYGRYPSPRPGFG